MSHKDFLGQPIEVGGFVVGVRSKCDTPGLYEVMGFTPKKVRIRLTGDDNLILKFPNELLVVDTKTARKQMKVQAKDALGQILNIGDYVFGNNGEYVDPIVFEIEDFSEDKVIVKHVYGGYYWGDNLKHGHDLVKISTPSLVTMHLLRDTNDDN